MERPVSSAAGCAAWCTGVDAHGGLGDWVRVFGVSGGLNPCGGFQQPLVYLLYFSQAARTMQMGFYRTVLLLKSLP